MRVPRFSMTPRGSFERALSALLLVSGLAGAALAQTPPASAAVHPTTPNSRASEIQRLLQNQQAGQALAMIDQALAHDPKDPAMRFRRGVALSLLDRKDEAVRAFQSLSDDRPEMPGPYNNLAVLYGSQGEYDKSRAALVAAIRSNPQYATAYKNLGDVYSHLADEAYTKALQLDKSDASLPPKLVLVRELISNPGAAFVAPVAVAAATPAPARLPVARTVRGAAVAPAPRSDMAPSTASMGTAPDTVPSAADTEVISAVHEWAAAWSQRNMEAYLAAYTPDYTTAGKSHASWADYRRARIVPRKRIVVGVSEVRVSVNGDQAQATFKQAYQSDTLATAGHKSLELVRSASGKWLIRRESVGG